MIWLNDNMKDRGGGAGGKTITGVPSLSKCRHLLSQGTIRSVLIFHEMSQVQVSQVREVIYEMFVKIIQPAANVYSSSEILSVG